MSLSDKVEEIISIRAWQFDSLPDQIVAAIDNLMLQYNAADLLQSMKALTIKLSKEEQSARKSRGNSGFAGELHMACEMKLKYLNQSIDYVSWAP